MKARMLEREFKARRVASDGDLLLLAPEDALTLIDRAAEEGVPIVEIDSFHFGGDAAFPRDQIADFSESVAEGHGCWADAEAFVRARAEAGLVFGLALGDDPLEVV